MPVAMEEPSDQRNPGRARTTNQNLVSKVKPLNMSLIRFSVRPVSSQDKANPVILCFSIKYLCFEKRCLNVKFEPDKYLAIV